MKLFKTMAGLAVAALMFAGAQAQAQVSTCGDKVSDLTAGQTIKVGKVSVSNDAEKLYVTYSLTYPGAVFGTLHAWAGSDLLNVPKNKQGTVVPGQFPFHSGAGVFPSSAGLTSYTFTIPFQLINAAGLPSVDASGNTTCNPLNLFVVTHAEVNIDSDNDGVADQHETAFGGGIPGDGPRWWFYDSYTICCDFGGGVPCMTETAFGKGGWVWTTNKNSNPEKLPSLALTKSRWGWAINVKTPGVSTHDIWAGAGLNNTANGMKVGTLTVNWNGAQAEVSYDLFSGYVMEEVHIYAADEKPTTVAPGQYGYPEAGYDAGGVRNFTHTVPLADAAGDGVWLIAHAVVSSEGQCAE